MCWHNVLNALVGARNRWGSCPLGLLEKALQKWTRLWTDQVLPGRTGFMTEGSVCGTAQGTECFPGKAPLHDTLHPQHILNHVSNKVPFPSGLLQPPSRGGNRAFPGLPLWGRGTHLGCEVQFGVSAAKAGGMGDRLVRMSRLRRALHPCFVVLG